jgi:hypothetical protein
VAGGVVACGDAAAYLSKQEEEVVGTCVCVSVLLVLV